MAAVRPLPRTGSIFLDARGGDRVLRVSWHGDDADPRVLVLSLWRDNVCVGSFRLGADEVPDLIDVLVDALRTTRTTTVPPRPALSDAG